MNRNKVNQFNKGDRMTSRELELKAVIESIDNDWYNDFKGYIFEDVDIVIFDENREKAIGIDKEEIKSFCTMMLEDYIPIRAAEEETTKIYMAYDIRFKELLKSLSEVDYKGLASLDSLKNKVFFL